MIIKYRNGENKEKIEISRIEIIITDDVKFNISLNKFNELVINKTNYGEGSGSISIEPHMSNEIYLK